MFHFRISVGILCIQINLEKGKRRMYAPVCHVQHSIGQKTVFFFFFDRIKDKVILTIIVIGKMLSKNVEMKERFKILLGVL